MAYLVQSDLENALSVQTVLDLYNDGNVGVVSTAALTAVISRACSMADSWAAPVYSGPFPITQSPIPALMKELALQYAIAYSFERNPDLVRALGEKIGVDDLVAKADKMGGRLQAAVLRMPDFVAQPKSKNVGGATVDNSARILIDGADGTINAGDF